MRCPFEGLKTRLDTISLHLYEIIIYKYRFATQKECHNNKYIIKIPRARAPAQNKQELQSFSFYGRKHHMTKKLFPYRCTALLLPLQPCNFHLYPMPLNVGVICSLITAERCSVIFYLNFSRIRCGMTLTFFVL